MSVAGGSAAYWLRRIEAYLRRHPEMDEVAFGRRVVGHGELVAQLRRADASLTTSVKRRLRLFLDAAK